MLFDRRFYMLFICFSIAVSIAVSIAISLYFHCTFLPQFPLHIMAFLQHYITFRIIVHKLHFVA